MKNKVYSFARFYDSSKIQDAVRVLLSAGIAREQIKVMSPTESSKRHSLNAPDFKKYALIGGLVGALGGALLGALMFVLPKFIWEYSYENELAVVGFILFIGVGLSIGVLQALMLVRRESGDHIIGPDEHGVFVTVQEGEEDKLNRAKDEYNRLDFANA